MVENLRVIVICEKSKVLQTTPHKYKSFKLENYFECTYN